VGQKWVIFILAKIIWLGTDKMDFVLDDSIGNVYFLLILSVGIKFCLGGDLVANSLIVRFCKIIFEKKEKYKIMKIGLC
jgi:hypothetical protein